MGKMAQSSLLFRKSYCQISGSESAPVQQLDDDADTREEVDQGARTGVKILATPAVRSVLPEPHTRERGQGVKILATPAVRSVVHKPHTKGMDSGFRLRIMNIRMPS
jgi:hypothetical protein